MDSSFWLFTSFLLLLHLRQTSRSRSSKRIARAALIQPRQSVLTPLLEITTTIRVVRQVAIVASVDSGRDQHLLVTNVWTSESSKLLGRIASQRFERPQLSVVVSSEDTIWIFADSLSTQQGLIQLASLVRYLRLAGFVCGQTFSEPGRFQVEIERTHEGNDHQA